jgi:hypothetical protein
VTSENENKRQSKRPPLKGCTAIARYLDEPEKRTYRLLETGEIPAGKLAGKWIADPDIIDQRLAEICSGKRWSR